MGRVAAATAIGAVCILASCHANHAAGSYYGPPPKGGVVAAGGTAGQVTNLAFTSDGREYLVHVGPVPMMPPSSDPARSMTYRQGGGVRVTATCAGSSQDSRQPDVTLVAGPLVASWTEAGAVVTVFSQKDTGPCSPSEAGARRLVALVRSLPRLSTKAWEHLVAQHPLDLSGGPDVASGSSR